MNYGIGLDCGIKSVGYCIMELNSDDEPKRIVRLNSRIFNEAENSDGSSLATPRREARGLRRRIRRHRHRLERIRALLIRENIVTQAELDNMFSGTLSDIYELRTAALDAPLNNIEFARVLINLAQRRGFKSNRKSEKSSSDKETGKLLSAIEKNKESIESGGYRTVGEMLFKDERYAKYKRNKGEAYLNTVSRDMIAAEIHAVFAAQRNFGMPFANEKIENEYTDIALSQRPFDLGPGEGPENCKSPYAGKQIKNMIGKCTFFPEEKRAVKASYSFQLFSLLQGINNITLVSSDGNTFPLSQEQRKTLKDYCFKTANVTYASIRKVLQIPQEYTFKNITYTDDGIEKSEKKTKFQHLKPYHEMKKVLGSAIQILTPEELDEIGEIFTFYKDETIIIKQLEETEIDKSLYDLLLQLPTFEKAGHISTKACKMIIPFLEEGKTYDKACECAGLNFKAHTNMQKQMLLPAKSDELDDIVNPVVRRAVSQTIKVVNAIIREMGTSPTYINIELARELSKSKKERDEINKKHKLNQAENEKLKDEISENGKKPNGQNIIKLKLWREQDGICPYTGVRIKYENLFDDGYAEIDHIIPYSLSFDDSFNNKILTTATQNRQKGNRIPLEYLPESEKDGFRVWVNSNIRNYRKRQNLLKEHFTEADKKEFKSRNLNDTRYLNKLLLNYINDNLLFTDFYGGKKKHVTSVNGAVTGYIRKRWGISKIREDGDLHHAVDAAVIACITQGMINRITAYSARNEAPYDLNTETGEIKERFPLPYTNFRNELEARTTIEDEKRLKSKLMSFSNYSYDDVEKAKPCFVSRMPHRKVTGAAHEDTIRSGKVEGFTVSKTELTKLKLKNGKIEGYYELKSSDTLLYNALLQRLNEFGGDAKAAFADEFHKPKADGTPGPIVKKVKIKKRSSSNVKARNKNGLGVAENDSMIRIDVFYVENEGYYFVPIYVADTVSPMLPNLACSQTKNGWKEMKDNDFIFSLYPNDLIKITAKKDMKFSLANKESGLPKNKYANEVLVYYSAADISNASISVIMHDNAYKFRGCGIKSLVKLEKYTVDPLGNVSKVNREKRMYFK